jgi:Protein of unknown function (DUF2637)
LADLLSQRWIVAGVAALAFLGLVVWLAASAEAGKRARFREVLAGLVQYGLLFGFAGVAAAISAHGLVGFARANMGLRGPWPVLLWGALDGAAGLCAVLLMRRAARGESALAPRLAVWGLVAASSGFNWAHAPDRPGARAAFALMPLIAAVLFEFSLRETRHTAGRPDRRLAGSRWLRPGERVRVWARLAADETLTVRAATQLVRVDAAAGRLHRLRQLPAAGSTPGWRGAVIAGRVRRAERLAQAALTRVRFTEPAVAAEVLRRAQILASTAVLASLDYSTAEPARAALASLIGTAGGPDDPGPAGHAPGPLLLPAFPARLVPGGHCAWPRGTAFPPVPSLPSGPERRADQGGVLLADPGVAQVNGNGPLIEAAREIIGQSRRQGVRLSQTALAGQLRARGFTIANERLRWLAAATGLDAGQAPG